MYTSAFDRSAALLVARLAPGGDEVRDFTAHIDRMISACAQTAGHHKTLCIMAIFEREHSLPSPKTRQAVAAATARSDFKPHLAVVTSNPLVRGVLTALSWLRKPVFAIKMFASTEEAIAWLEQKRGEPLPGLGELLSEVMTENERAAV